MAQQNLDPHQAPRSLLRRVVSQSPIVLAVYAMSSVALGFGFNYPAWDAIALTSTAVGFAAGDVGIRRATRHIDSLG